MVVAVIPSERSESRDLHLKGRIAAPEVHAEYAESAEERGGLLSGSRSMLRASVLSIHEPKNH